MDKSMKGLMARSLAGGTRNRSEDDSPARLLLRLFRDVGRKYFWSYLLAAFFLIVIAGSTALTAWILQDVVNEVFVDRHVDRLILLAATVFAISLARGLGSFGAAVILARVGSNISARMQQRMFKHLLTLGMDFYQRFHSPDLMTRMSISARAAADLLNIVLISFGRDLLTLIGLVAVMFLQSPWMTLIALMIGPPAIIGVNRLVKQFREVVRAEFSSIIEIIASLQETTNGIRIVKAFGLDAAMRMRMRDAIEGNRKRMDKMASIKARTGPLMETLAGFGIAGVVLWAGYAAIYASELPGGFVSFIAAVILAYEPAKRLANTRVQIELGTFGTSMLYRILDTPPSMDANPLGPELEIDGGRVVFDKVEFGYSRRAKVLNGLELCAEAGKVTALVGPSGAGKTTILNLIERFYDAESGTIAIDGQDISKVRLASLRGQLALVTQDTTVFRATIRENIRFGRPSASDAEVEEAARNAMAHDFIVATKGGYDTVLADEGIRLSGGQAQRIAIARAMLRNPKILLLDEATSALDSASEQQVNIALERLMRSRTTIVIAHRLSTVVGADRICVILGGKLIEQGKHEELLAARGHYAQLYQAQFSQHGTAGKPGSRSAAGIDLPAAPDQGVPPRRRGRRRESSAVVS